MTKESAFSVHIREGGDAHRPTTRRQDAEIPVDELCQLYPALHETDISKGMDMIHKRLYPKSALKIWRQKRQLSQSQLAKISGVNRRSIKAYEQGELDVGKARYETLASLANTLSCYVRDLILYEDHDGTCDRLWQSPGG